MLTAWVTQVRVQGLRQGATLPPLPHPQLPPTCHRAAVRGAGPAAKLLLFIHRPCHLQPLPSFLPTSHPPRHGFLFWTLAPRVGVGVGQAQTATGLQTEDAPLCAGVRGRPGAEGQDAGWRAATGGGLFVSLKGLGCSLFGVTGGHEEWHPWGVRPAKQPCFWPLWSLRDLAIWIPTGVFSHSPPQSPRP